MIYHSRDLTGGVRRRGCPDHPPPSASGQRSNSRVDLENNQVPSLAHRRVEKTHKSLLSAIHVRLYVCSRFSGQTPPGGSMKRHPSPGASGLRQLPRGMSEARTVGSPPYYSINGWRLSTCGSPFQILVGGPDRSSQDTLVRPLEGWASFLVPKPTGRRPWAENSVEAMRCGHRQLRSGR